MVRRALKYAIGGVLLLLALSVIQALRPLHAQTSFGTIVGTVTDTSQAAIPDVSVTVTNTATGISREIKTSALGDYRVDALLPGVYKITAEHPGFQRTELAAITVPVAVTVTANILMQVGAVTQTVEVTAAAPLLESATATLGNVVNNTSVVTLPLNGRNFTDLIRLVPGSVPSGGGTFMVSGGTNFSVSGNRAEQNNFTLDGVYNNEEFFKQFSIQPSIDAIQEFKIQTNITSAEYGQAAGANINVAIKSGTNNLHGSAFEFLRNDKLDAIDWFRNYSSTPSNPAERAPYKRNQYGGVIGGPVVIPHVYNGHDRTFWLFNYEGIRVRQASSVLRQIPTAEQFGGDLRDQNPIFDPATTRLVGTANGSPLYARDQISCNGVANVICPDRINPFVKDYIPIFYPQINAAGQHNADILNTSPFKQNQYQWTTRIDHKIKDNLFFFSRFSMADADQISATDLPTVSTFQTNKFRNFVASWTYAVSPTMVADLKLGYNRSNLQITHTNPAPGWVSFLAAHPIQGTPVKNSKQPLFAGLFFDEGGYANPTQDGYPFPSNEYQVLASITKTMGRQTLKAGMDFTDMRNLDDGNFTSYFHFNSSPTADPQNSAGTGSVLASYLLGLPYQGLRNLGETAAYMRQPRYQFYLQDDIKVTRKLTLNLGMRYEYNKWPVDRWDRLAGFDPTTPPNGAYLWAGKNPITGQGPNVRRSVRDPDFNNFAPRLGLAYLVTPKTTFRGSYGIFYVSNQLWEAQGTRGNWPYAISQTLSSTNLTFPDKPLQTFFTPDVAPGPDSVPSSQHVLGRKDRTAYAQQWSSGVQRELSQSLLLEVDYVGSRGVKQALFTNINSALPGPGDVGTDAHPRPYGNSLGAMSMMSNSASSIYHSAQVKLEKRFSNGLQFLTSYAWGKELDMGGSGFANSVAPQDPLNPGADRAPGIFDYRHIFTFSYFYQLPFGKGKQFLSGLGGPLNQIVGGWEMTGIVHYNTGGPVNVGMNQDVANIGPRSGGQRPNRVGPSHKLLDPGDKTKGWLDPSAYATPELYTFGNLGRNTERGPGFGNWDWGLLKSFKLPGESNSLQFRAEFFNLFNNVNCRQPELDLL